MKETLSRNLFDKYGRQKIASPAKPTKISPVMRHNKSFIDKESLKHRKRTKSVVLLRKKGSNVVTPKGGRTDRKLLHSRGEYTQLAEDEIILLVNVHLILFVILVYGNPGFTFVLFIQVNLIEDLVLKDLWQVPIYKSSM